MTISQDGDQGSFSLEVASGFIKGNFFVRGGCAKVHSLDFLCDESDIVNEEELGQMIEDDSDFDPCWTAAEEAENRDDEEYHRSVDESFFEKAEY